MAKISNQIIDQAINSLPEVFDTHEVIQKVMQNAPREYAVDLEATSGDDPIKNLHSSIGTRLKGIGAIEATKKVTSVNVRGGENRNQEWRKK